jgi:dipeptide transport system substrate-binding protein
MKIASTQSQHRFVRVALIVALAAVPLSALAKGTLVYCSEGSPEGFQPQFFITDTTFDAVSVPMFNRLVQFEIGTTNLGK